MARPRKRQKRRGYQPGHHASPGQGSIVQVKSGRWRGAFTWHDPDTGRTRRVWVTGDDEDDVLRRWAARRAELDGTAPPPDAEQTLAQYLLHWLDTAVRPTARVTTYELYARYAARVSRDLGRYTLAALRPAHLRQFYAAMQASGQWGPKTLATVHGMLTSAFRQAVAWGDLEVSPLRGVRAPRAPQREHRTLSPDELRRVLAVAAAAGDGRYALWLLAATTAMRRGELIGLRWQDVDLEAGTIAVRGQLVQTSSGVVRAPPKTRSAERPISLMPVVAEALRRHRAARERVTEYVFTRGDGAPLSPGLVDAAWRRLRTRAGIPPVRLHDLRHGVATLGLRYGVPSKVMQELLGHHDVRMTLNTYSHVVPGMHAEAMALLQRVIWPDTPPVVAPVVAREGENRAC